MDRVPGFMPADSHGPSIPLSYKNTLFTNRLQICSNEKKPKIQIFKNFILVAQNTQNLPAVWKRFSVGIHFKNSISGNGHDAGHFPG
ncbi:MAG: hypothetical protein J6A23_14150 [Thermoguttaceae bacterium]|nr:hypothetical protein [Thermoguttaceae bacterium]